MKLFEKKKSAAKPKITFAWVQQFKNLDSKDPSSWPSLPKVALFGAVVLVTVVLFWFGFLRNFEEDLVREEQNEVSLRKDYEAKLKKAVSLEGLKKQREQVQMYVLELEKQLPNRSEMSALLTDINRAGLGRNLQFEIFKPGQEVVKDYYAELPISIKISGNFHDVGMFASDIAFLSRIVTLNDISIAPQEKGGALTLNAVAQTYRYLDASEINARNTKARKKVNKK